ncbi:MAG TPA: class I SAM-dependent methyltransferase [Gemmatimonadales bacterium]|jgi:SAM-dependent methyltransferase|nr:class I SAM-dependent methyltransferase [Gemmatimonadales bacterium]
MSATWLEQAYWRVEQFVVPGLQYSQDSYADALDGQVAAHTAWLELGCGHQILPAWRAARERALVARARCVVGVDRVSTALQRHQTIARLAAADIAELPFRGEQFDLVTANMVVEHLQEPERLFGEVWRVMKPGGRFLFHTPNTLGYSTVLARLVPEWMKQPAIRVIEGRWSHDVFPTHYQANSRKAIARIAGTVGFEVATIQLVDSAAEFIRFLPFAVLELLWIRLLRTTRLDGLRTNIIAVLRKPAPPPASSEGRGAPVA